MLVIFSPTNVTHYLSKVSELVIMVVKVLIFLSG